MFSDLCITLLLLNPTAATNVTNKFIVFDQELQGNAEHLHVHQTLANHSSRITSNCVLRCNTLLLLNPTAATNVATKFVVFDQELAGNRDHLRIHLSIENKSLTVTSNCVLRCNTLLLLYLTAATHVTNKFVLFDQKPLGNGEHLHIHVTLEKQSHQ